ncbi:MAG TPA: hypothetical protein VN345_14455 [Blastocatellia bacterium]|nr:hypothetical protein [Blastocatellia bacterium]
MKDDYLWDRSGEPDPELDRIEQELSRFRHRPRPLDLPAAPEPVVWTRYAAAAAILFAVLAVFVWMSVRRQKNPYVAPNVTAENIPPAVNPGPPPASVPDSQHASDVATTSPPRRVATSRGNIRHGNRAANLPADTDAENYTLSAALLDPEVASHMEKAQLLLRAFRNSSPSDDDGIVDISYERHQSQEILYQNMLLRREAETRGNVPVGELLSSLEPLLLDISNLPDNAREEEVQGIKNRIEKEQIVAALQSYSSMLAAAL